MTSMLVEAMKTLGVRRQKRNSGLWELSVVSELYMLVLGAHYGLYGKCDIGALRTRVHVSGQF